MSKPLLRPFMPELNSIRGLACLAVLFFHGLWWYIPKNAVGLLGSLRDATSQGLRGVNLFFVLSGLLITNILLSDRERPYYFARFYKRRALRILPAYYLILALLALYGTPKAFLGMSLLYAANMAPLAGIPMAYGPLWSLAVEEQFYLLWPLLVRKLRLDWLIGIGVCFFVGGLALMLRLKPNTPFATFPIWYAGHGLGLGALLAIFLRSKWATRKNVMRFGVLFGLLAAVAVWLAIVTHSPVSQYALREGVWDLIFANVILLALLLGSSPLERWARPHWLQCFGEISYGLYLVHVLVFMVYRRFLHPSDGLADILVQFVICTMISVGIATLSRFTVEEWFLSMKDREWKMPRWNFRNAIRISVP